ncbi:MAG: hypothetical protein WA419_12210 [Silvibacterium sp.]
MPRAPREIDDEKMSRWHGRIQVGVHQYAAPEAVLAAGSQTTRATLIGYPSAIPITNAFPEGDLLYYL